MAHGREQLRDAIVTLVTGLTTTSTRVHRNRTWKYAEGALPCLNVISGDEELNEEISQLGITRVAECDFIIEGRAQEKADLDEKLDDIAAEVEVAIAGAPTLGGKCHWITYQGSEVGMDEEATQPIGLIRLHFLCRYETTFALPTTLLLGGS